MMNFNVLRRLTQHKRFVPYSTHSNPSLTLRTFFMLETLGEIQTIKGSFENAR